ncbi:hypothetical protein CGQ24_12030 [Arthrobacter sp. 7749]|nr:hypothetical protein CGQ24_12030 [Arthrobacter sp. 7749]
MAGLAKRIHTNRRNSQHRDSTRRGPTVDRVVLAVCLVAIIGLVIRSVIKFMHGVEPVTYRGSQQGAQPHNSAVAD